MWGFVTVALLDTAAVLAVVACRWKPEYERAMLTGYALAAIAIVGGLTCLISAAAHRHKPVTLAFFVMHALIFLGLFFIADRGLFVGGLR